MLMAEARPTRSPKSRTQRTESARLADLCLPITSADRLGESLSWTAAVSTAFLCVGLIGLFTRPIQATVAAAAVEEPIPVLFEAPPQESAPLDLEAASAEEPVEPLSEVASVPQIVQVAAADAIVAFSVPTVGVVVPTRLAQAPPARPLQAAVVSPSSAPVALFTGVGTSGNFPHPTYPAEARRRGVEGTVELLVEVGPDGVPTKVEVFESSGSLMIDWPAVEWVRKRYLWPEGPVRRYRIPFEFRLKK
jgi:protein TonB